MDEKNRENIFSLFAAANNCRPNLALGPALMASYPSGVTSVCHSTVQGKKGEGKLTAEFAVRRRSNSQNLSLYWCQNSAVLTYQEARNREQYLIAGP
jgi:hypothetical protein